MHCSFRVAQAQLYIFREVEERRSAEEQEIVSRLEYVVSEQTVGPSEYRYVIKRIFSGNRGVV